jgi:hypothetical protein
MDHYRRREAQQDTAGHELVSYIPPVPTEESALVLREEPPED